jgi:polypeptide N-acetylgalactosaminyltransferase
MSGGLLAMLKSKWYELGEYDEGLEIWGYENIEMSVRLWCCGAKIEILPCSRVGHMFRDAFPFTYPKGMAVTQWRNRKRVAEVWLDKQKRYIYNYYKPGETMDAGDFSSRLKLKKDLNCKSFDWYMQNIYPDLQYKRNVPKQMLTPKTTVVFITVATGKEVPFARQVHTQHSC